MSQPTADREIPENAEYQCVCGGFVSLKDYHYIFYPEPDCCCFYFQCAECGIRIAQHDQERFRAQFKDIS